MIRHCPGEAPPALAIARNSPLPDEAAYRLQLPGRLVSTPELDYIPRPAIIVGGLPCERMASAVRNDPGLAYVLVMPGNQVDAGEPGEWVDAIVWDPPNEHRLYELGCQALATKPTRVRPSPIVSDQLFAWSGYTAEISQLEAKILRRLARAQGTVVAKPALAYELWGCFDADPGRAIPEHIYRIRKRLQHIPGVTIETVRQRGYALRLDAA